MIRRSLLAATAMFCALLLCGSTEKEKGFIANAPGQDDSQALKEKPAHTPGYPGVWFKGNRPWRMRYPHSDLNSGITVFADGVGDRDDMFEGLMHTALNWEGDEWRPESPWAAVAVLRLHMIHDASLECKDDVQKVPFMVREEFFARRIINLASGPMGPAGFSGSDLSFIAERSSEVTRFREEHRELWEKELQRKEWSGVEIWDIIVDSWVVERKLPATFLNGPPKNQIWQGAPLIERETGERFANGWNGCYTLEKKADGSTEVSFQTQSLTLRFQWGKDELPR